MENNSGKNRKRRISSILKKSPSRIALAEVENVDILEDPTVTSHTDVGSKKRCSRRVSFANSNQVKEIARAMDIANEWQDSLSFDNSTVKDPASLLQHNITRSNKRQSQDPAMSITGLQKLLSAPIVKTDTIVEETHESNSTASIAITKAANSSSYTPMFFDNSSIQICPVSTPEISPDVSLSTEQEPGKNIMQNKENILPSLDLVPVGNKSALKPVDNKINSMEFINFLQQDATNSQSSVTQNINKNPPNKENLETKISTAQFYNSSKKTANQINNPIVGNIQEDFSGKISEKLSIQANTQKVDSVEIINFLQNINKENDVPIISQTCDGDVTRNFDTDDMNLTECLPITHSTMISHTPDKNTAAENTFNGKTILDSSGMDFTTCVQYTQSENEKNHNRHFQTPQSFTITQKTRKSYGLDVTYSNTPQQGNSTSKIDNSVATPPNRDRIEVITSSENQPKSVSQEITQKNLNTFNKLASCNLYSEVEDKTEILSTGMDLTECISSKPITQNFEEVSHQSKSADKANASISQGDVSNPVFQPRNQVSTDDTLYQTQLITNDMEISECITRPTISEDFQPKTSEPINKPLENEEDLDCVSFNPATYKKAINEVSINTTAETSQFEKGFEDVTKNVTEGMDLTECLPIIQNHNALSQDNRNLTPVSEDLKTDDKTELLLTGMDLTECLPRNPPTQIENLVSYDSSTIQNVTPGLNTNDQTEILSTNMDLTECLPRKQVNQISNFASHDNSTLGHVPQDLNNDDKTELFLTGMDLTECISHNKNTELNQDKEIKEDKHTISVDDNSNKTEMAVAEMELTECIIPVQNDGISLQSKNKSEILSTGVELEITKSLRPKSIDAGTLSEKQTVGLPVPVNQDDNTQQSSPEMDLTTGCLTFNKSSSIIEYDQPEKENTNITLPEFTNDEHTEKLSSAGMDITECIPRKDSDSTSLMNNSLYAHFAGKPITVSLNNSLNDNVNISPLAANNISVQITNTSIFPASDCSSDEEETVTSVLKRRIARARSSIGVYAARMKRHSSSDEKDEPVSIIEEASVNELVIEEEDKPIEKNIQSNTETNNVKNDEYVNDTNNSGAGIKTAAFEIAQNDDCLAEHEKSLPETNEVFEQTAPMEVENKELKVTEPLVTDETTPTMDVDNVTNEQRNATKTNKTDVKLPSPTENDTMNATAINETANTESIKISWSEKLSQEERTTEKNIPVVPFLGRYTTLFKRNTRPRQSNIIPKPPTDLQQSFFEKLETAYITAREFEMYDSFVKQLEPNLESFQKNISMLEDNLNSDNPDIIHRMRSTSDEVVKEECIQKIEDLSAVTKSIGKAEWTKSESKLYKGIVNSFNYVLEEDLGPVIKILQGFDENYQMLLRNAVEENMSISSKLEKLRNVKTPTEEQCNALQDMNTKLHQLKEKSSLMEKKLAEQKSKLEAETKKREQFYDKHKEHTSLKSKYVKESPIAQERLKSIEKFHSFKIEGGQLPDCIKMTYLKDTLFLEGKTNDIPEQSHINELSKNVSNLEIKSCLPDYESDLQVSMFKFIHKLVLNRINIEANKPLSLVKMHRMMTVVCSAVKSLVNDQLLHCMFNRRCRVMFSTNDQDCNMRVDITPNLYGEPKRWHGGFSITFYFNEEANPQLSLIALAKSFNPTSFDIECENESLQKEIEEKLNSIEDTANLLKLKSMVDFILNNF